VNTDVEYRRHSQRPSNPVAVRDSADDLDGAASRLAHRHDPSLDSAAPARPTTALGMTWVRPSELGAYSTPIVGRGIDLQAELIRRARRTPVTTTRALSRLVDHPTAPTPGSISTPPPPPSPPASSVATTEGPSL
jgi:hypothetical protein